MYCHHILANPLIALILETQFEDFGSKVEHISDSAVKQLGWKVLV